MVAPPGLLTPPEMVAPPGLPVPPELVIPPDLVAPPELVPPPELVAPPALVVPPELVPPPELGLPPDAMVPLAAEELPLVALKPPVDVVPPGAGVPSDAELTPVATLAPVATLPPEGAVLLGVPPWEVVPPVDAAPVVLAEHPHNSATPAEATTSANNRTTDMCGGRPERLIVMESSCLDLARGSCAAEPIQRLNRFASPWQKVLLSPWPWAEACSYCRKRGFLTRSLS